MQQHREVQVVAAGQAGLAAASELLALLHLVARRHRDRRQVRVQALQPRAVVDDDAIAVDAEVVGAHHRAAVGGPDRRVRRRREVETEVHLLIHLFALVQVRAVVGKTRFHLRVGKLPEPAVPEHPRRGARGQLDQGLPVAPPQLAVDEQVQIEPVLVGAVRLLVRQFRNLADDGRHDPPQEPVAHRDARPPEIAGETPVIELGAPFVPGRVRGIQLDRRAQVLVVLQGEEGETQVVARPVDHAGRRVTGIQAVTDPHAGRGVRRRHRVDDHLRSAVIHVMEGRGDRKPRRVEPDLDVDRHCRAPLAQTEQDGPGGRDPHRGRSGPQLGVRLAVERAADADLVGAFLADVGGCWIVKRKQRKRRAVLLDDGIERGQLGAGCCHRRLERGAAADKARRTNQLYRRPLRAAQYDTDADTCSDDRHQGEDCNDEDRATHGSMI